MPLPTSYTRAERRQRQRAALRSRTRVGVMPPSARRDRKQAPHTRPGPNGTFWHTTRTHPSIRKAIRRAANKVARVSRKANRSNR